MPFFPLVSIPCPWDTKFSKPPLYKLRIHTSQPASHHPHPGWLQPAAPPCYSQPASCHPHPGWLQPAAPPCYSQPASHHPHPGWRTMEDTISQPASSTSLLQLSVCVAVAMCHANGTMATTTCANVWQLLVLMCGNYFLIVAVYHSFNSSLSLSLSLVPQAIEPHFHDLGCSTMRTATLITPQAVAQPRSHHAPGCSTMRTAKLITPQAVAQPRSHHAPGCSVARTATRPSPWL